MNNDQLEKEFRMEYLYNAIPQFFVTSHEFSGQIFFGELFLKDRHQIAYRER
jgi:hypothetical protein